MKWDQGLGAIGLLVMATALALLLTMGIPISASKDTVELKDWLGFAGNVLGAFVTVIAATIAWFAVQKQIGVERDATVLEIITREEDRIEEQIPILMDISGIAFECIMQAGTFVTAAEKCRSRDRDQMPALNGAANALDLHFSGSVPLMVEKLAPELRGHVATVFWNLRQFALDCATANNDVIAVLDQRVAMAPDAFEERLRSVVAEFEDRLNMVRIYISYANQLRQQNQDRIMTLQHRARSYRREIERILLSKRS